LTTGKVLDATCFPVSVVCFDDLPKKIKPTDRLFYGQYCKKSIAILDLLAELTGGQFKNGAIARILAREFWSKGTHISRVRIGLVKGQGEPQAAQS
jgi:hypothetical protein